MRVTQVAVAARQVTTLLGKVSYDYLVIPTSTTANFFGNQQMQQYAFPLKQFTDAMNLRSQVLQ